MKAHFDRETPVKNLPDAYCKKADSNNAKILEIEKIALDTLRREVSAIFDSLDIDKAYGKTLDLYGEMIGQARGVATDEQYRVLMKSRLVRNLSDADHASIVRAICVTFNCDPSEVLLTEPGEPCVVKLEGLPIAKLNESNIDIETAARIVYNLIPAGVYMEALNFSGTFEFGTTELEYDAESGFGDIDQTIGGYLGLLSDSQGSNLPV